MLLGGQNRPILIHWSPVRLLHGPPLKQKLASDSSSAFVPCRAVLLPKTRIDYFRATTAAAVVVELNKGQRFEMVQDLGEGSCRIEFEGNRFDLQSCPWLPGFRDPQSDVFRVVAD